MRSFLLLGTAGFSLFLAAAGCGESGGDQPKTATASSGGGASGGGTATSATGSGSSTASGPTTGATTTAGAGGATGASTGAATTTGTGAGGAAAGLVRFVAIGDAGKGNTGQSEVAAAIAAKCAQSGCDFVQLLGDNIYDSGVDSTSDPQWQTKFEQPYSVVDLPFWVVLGNHDYGGNGSGSDFAKGQNEIDYTNVSPSMKWKLPSAYYKRDLAHVGFFALDTNMAMYHQADQQTSDMTGWITQSQQYWKIAFGHHPYRSNGPHGNAGEYEGLPFVPIANGAGVKDILEASVCGKADVYICGHDHSLQWMTETCSGTELIVSGAGASSTELDGDNPTHFQSLELGFVYVAIDGGTFTAEFIDTMGQVLFTKTLTK